MKRILFSLFLMAMSVMAGKASVVLNSTNFPDATFRAYVSEITGVGVGGTISDAQLQSVISISVNNKGITSLKGVEYFTALTTLYCENNQLSSLDVSHNTALEYLYCHYNQLPSLDVSHNTALERLYCYSNQLTSLDVSGATALTSLGCSENQLTSLDVSHNTALTNLQCYNNQLSSLDVSHNTALEYLYCHYNQLPSLDVSHNTALATLECDHNQLTSLDVSGATALTYLECRVNLLTSLDVSGATALEYLYCRVNLLTSLEVSHNTALTYLDCEYNQLTSLDVSHNTALTELWCNSNQLMNLDLSKCTKLKLGYTSVGSQSKSVIASSLGSNQYSIDVPADFDISKVFSFTVNSPRVTPTMSNGKLVFTSSSTPASITYQYDTSNSVAGKMWVSLSITEIIGETTYYDLTISASGNGSATYSGTSIRNKSQTFSVVEGTNATITFTPDTGYRIKSVKKNGTEVTSSVSNNKYTVSNISANTTVAVVFEEIPPTYYDLTISASGNGSATYSGTSIRNKSQTFSVAKGTNATITFTPDTGYRIKSVKVGSTDVTSNVKNNQYTVSNISANTTVAVVFEEIPQTYYDLTISASGNGSATYSGTSIRNKSQTFSVVEGTNATITFTPDTGYRIKSVKKNGSDVTSSVSNNQYTVSNISANTTVAVVFEEIPQTYYDLTISATGNGSATYSGTSIRNKSQTFSVVEGTNATITFTPDAGYRIKSVKVGSTDVTSNVKNNQYTVSNIEANKTVTVVFEENVYDGFTADGITYHVSSAALRTVEVKGVSTEHAVIPERVAQYDDTWKVTAIADGAFRDGQQLVSVSVPASIETVPDGLFTSCPRLCAVVWHASVPLTAGVLGAVTNPNLLVYVDSQEQTTLSVPNIIVNGMAEEITLTEASDGNDFYCPATFSARQVSYVRHFGMTTGIGECRGWESIVLPFSVQTFYHATRGELIPFAAWDGVHGKPFWLLYYGADGFTETGSLEANVPYIISMPNNPKYASDYNLSGDITFSARNAVVKASTEMAGVTGNGKTFVPSFAHEENTADAFILNVNGSFVNYGGAYPEGSVFIRNLRDIRPFEAYFTNVQQAKEVLPVFDDETTPVHSLPVDAKLLPRVTVYSVTGQLMKSEKNITIEEALQGLSRGVYIVNGQKYAVYEKGMEE